MVPIQNKSLFGTSLTAQPTSAPAGNILGQNTNTYHWGNLSSLQGATKRNAPEYTSKMIVDALAKLGYQGPSNYTAISSDRAQLAQMLGMDPAQLESEWLRIGDQSNPNQAEWRQQEYLDTLRNQAASKNIENFLKEKGYNVETWDTQAENISQLRDAQGNVLAVDANNFARTNARNDRNAIVAGTVFLGGAAGLTGGFGGGAASTAGGGGVGGLGASAGGAAYLPAAAYNPAIGSSIGAYSAGASGTGVLGSAGALGAASGAGGAATTGLGSAGAGGVSSGGLLSGAGGTAATTGTGAATGASNMGWMDWGEKLVNVGSKLYDAKNAKDAASQLASSQEAAARAAAEEARFRPIGVTNAFGSSNFKFDPVTGRLSEAGYTVDPKLAALRDQLLGLAGTNGQQLGQANQAFLQGQQGLFGSVANAGDIQGQTQRLFQQRQDLLAPQRERDLANLRNQSYQAGRSGLAVGGTSAGDYAAANPEMQAFFNAQRQKDNELLAGAEQDARNYRSNDISTLASLFSGQSGSLQPILQMLQGSGGIEEMGRGSFDLGMALGGRNANPTGASALLSGLTSAANSNAVGTSMQNAGYSSLFGGLADLFKEYNKKPKTGSTE